MEKKIFATDQGRIVYWRGGAVGREPALVFLPGLTADHRLFDAQTAFFEPERTVLTWDAPGHGESRPFAMRHALADWADWLQAILTREGIERPVLVGQSMGGYVAQCYLERFPGRLSGFIAIDSAPLQRRYVTAAELWLMRHVGPFYRAYPWGLLQRDGARGCAETEHGRQLMRTMMAVYDKKEYCGLAAAGYALLAGAYGADLPYRIDCPALLLCGARDRAGATRRYNRRWAEEEGLELVWIDGAGHNSNTDRPELVNGLIAGFLERLGELSR